MPLVHHQELHFCTFWRVWQEAKSLRPFTMSGYFLSAQAVFETFFLSLVEKKGDQIVGIFKGGQRRAGEATYWSD